MIILKSILIFGNYFKIEKRFVLEGFPDVLTCGNISSGGDGGGNGNA